MRAPGGIALASRCRQKARGKTLWLRFGGINYRANIWVNGQQLAGSSDVAGAYRTYEFDVTRLLKPGKENAIAVETFAPTEHDLAINWVDWSPCPPDKDMGLTGDVGSLREWAGECAVADGGDASVGACR